MKIAVIGAGLSGLTVANGLKDVADVSVFEKARGAGGRMSTRYADPYQFDHGAQYFTARSPEFHGFLKPHIENGLVQEWHPKVVTLEMDEKPYKRDWFEPHYVVAPRMNMLVKTLAKDINLSIQVEVARLEETDAGWVLHAKDGEAYGPFDWVISSAPSHQAANLIPSHFKDYARIADAKMDGNYTLMLGLKGPWMNGWQAAEVKNSPIGWIALNSHKPERETEASLVVQSTNDWAEEHIEDVEGAKKAMIEALHGLVRKLPDYEVLGFHRWRYASAPEAQGDAYLIDPELKLGVCGDWLIKGRVEAAYLSGYRLIQSMNALS
ncbi:MAG: NAD(P)/FAD-dependent oxidoreductase [Bdellovibrionales bacterium]